MGQMFTRHASGSKSLDHLNDVGEDPGALSDFFATSSPTILNSNRTNIDSDTSDHYRRDLDMLALVISVLESFKPVTNKESLDDPVASQSHNPMYGPYPLHFH